MNTGLACRGQGAVMGLAAGMRHFGRDRGGLSWFVFWYDEGQEHAEILPYLHHDHSTYANKIILVLTHQIQ